MSVTKWFKETVTKLVDPDRQVRIDTLVTSINQHLSRVGKNFSLSAAIQGVPHSESDLAQATERVYRGVLERSWADGEISTKELEVAQWFQTSLMLSQEKARNINVELAKYQFGVFLAKSLEDGVLQPSEEAHLAKIARTVGSTLPQFMRYFFQHEGSAFLRSLFLACIEDNVIASNEWNYLLHLTGQFGLSRDELMGLIQPQARSFVEHILADAKTDQRISNIEEGNLQWLLINLALPQDFVKYVQTEIQLLKDVELIESGKLPVVNPAKGIEIKSGEIVHWWGNATWKETKFRRDQPVEFLHHGIATFCDSRFIFSALTRSQSLNYRKIVAHNGGVNWVELQVENRPADTFFLNEPTPLAYLILAAAIGAANQTRIVSIEGHTSNSRHIPRDVRQRVWQRYGGRCAECSAEEYLEFDHVIPVARGGGNFDNNIQLLCRKCNLKKSDHI